MKINLQGSDYSDGDVKTAGINGINSAAIQTEEISFNNTNDYKLIATLAPEASSNPRGKAGITGINPLPNDIRYNVVVLIVMVIMLPNELILQEVSHLFLLLQG